MPVEIANEAREFAEAFHSEGRELLRFLRLPLDRRPRAPAHQRGAHARSDGRAQVVVNAITDVEDLVVGEGGDFCDAPEELRVRFAGAPVVARADEVYIFGEEFTEDLPGTDRLVACDTEPQSVGAQLRMRRPDVVIKVLFAERLRLPGGCTLLPLVIQVEAGLENVSR